MNSVENLLKINFSFQTLEEKIQIKKLGRPMSNLNLTQITKQKSGRYTRHFTNDYYNKFNWLCGCEVSKLLI